MRILLVEDHDHLVAFIKAGLEQEGFTVDSFLTAADGDAAFSTVTYDAVVLDLGLPDADGLTLLKTWRDQGNSTPVLILTSRGGVGDRVRGLNLGADDYLLKPFELEELVARVRALLRRPARALGSVIEVGNITFDTSAREVSVNGKVVHVSRREMAVLEHLIRRAQHVVTKDFFEEKIYGFDEEVCSNSIQVHISRLRKRLSEANSDCVVQTVRGVGYLLAVKKDLDESGLQDF